MRRYRQAIKQRAFEVLGQECLRCGFDADLRALEFDHVANDGKKHRKEVGVGGALMLAWIVKHPAEALQRVQVLCANCNTIKEAVHRAI